MKAGRSKPDPVASRKQGAKPVKTKKSPKDIKAEVPDAQCPQLLKSSRKLEEASIFVQYDLARPGNLVLRHRILRVLS